MDRVELKHGTDCTEFSEFYLFHDNFFIIVVVVFVVGVGVHCIVCCGVNVGDNPLTEVDNAVRSISPPLLFISRRHAANCRPLTYSVTSINSTTARYFNMAYQGIYPDRLAKVCVLDVKCIMQNLFL